MRVIPTCHPERRHYARRLCANCYHQRIRKGRHGDTHPRLVRTRDEFLADYIVLRGEGYTTAQIAERLGVTHGAVNQALSRARRAGVEVPG